MGSTGDFYSETLSEKSAKNFNFTSKKCVTVFIIGLVLIASTCALVIVFIVRGQSTKGQTDTIRKEYEVEITILEEWNDKFADKNSSVYQEKVDQIQRELDAVLKKGRLADVYDSVRVIGLRQGSIIIDVLVVLHVSYDDVNMDTGSVTLVVKDSGSKVEVTELITESIGETTSLEIDKDNVKIKASVTLKTTTSDSSLTRTSTVPTSKGTTSTSITSTTATKPTTGPGPPSPDPTTRTTSTSTVTSTTATKPTTGPGPPSPDPTTRTTSTSTVTSTTATKPTTGPGPLSPDPTTRTTSTSTVTSTTATKPTTGPGPPSPDPTTRTTSTSIVTSTTATKPTTGPGPPSPDPTTRTTSTSTVTSTTATKPTTGPGPLPPDPTTRTTPTITLTSTTATKPTAGPGPPSPDPTSRTTSTSTVTSTTATKPTTGPGPLSPDPTTRTTSTSTVTSTTATKPTTGPGPPSPDPTTRTTSTSIVTSTTATKPTTGPGPPSPDPTTRTTSTSTVTSTTATKPTTGPGPLPPDPTTRTTPTITLTSTTATKPTTGPGPPSPDPTTRTTSISTAASTTATKPTTGPGPPLPDPTTRTTSISTVTSTTTTKPTTGPGPPSPDPTTRTTSTSTVTSTSATKPTTGPGPLSPDPTTRTTSTSTVTSTTATKPTTGPGPPSPDPTTRTTSTSTVTSTTATKPTTGPGPRSTTRTTQPDTVTSTATTKSITRPRSSTQASVKESNVFGLLVLDEAWSDNLVNKDSTEFQQLAESFSANLTSVFKETLFGDNLAEVTVLSARLGSIIVDFRLSFRNLQIVFENEVPKAGQATTLEILSALKKTARNFPSNALWDTVAISVCPTGKISCTQKNSQEEIVCINEEAMCDGNEDCPGNADELNCDLYRNVSVNCTFDNGTCGYFNARPHNRNDIWNRSPIQYTDGQHIGYVMTATYTFTSRGTVNLGSPRFTARSTERCLTFQLFTSTRNLGALFKIFASTHSVVQPIRQWGAANFRHYDFLTNSTKLSVNLPAYSEQVFFQMAVEYEGLVNSVEFDYFLALDDISLSSRPCPQVPVTTDFAEVGFSGYQSLYNTNTWRSELTDVVDSDRHIAFASRNRFGFPGTHLYENGCISSPVIRQSALKGCLSMRYKFDTEFTTSLWVYIVKGELPTREEDFDGDLILSLPSAGHQTWRYVSIPLDHFGAHTYRIVFKGHGITDNTGFIRIDNIELSTNTCTIPSCSENEFRCSSTLTCIPRSAVCNTVQDCSSEDLSDENNDMCGESVSCNFNSSYLCGYKNTSGLSTFWVPTKIPDGAGVTPIRLISGTDSSGRVEIFKDGVWGTICSQGFGQEEGQVICSMLGFERYEFINCCGSFGLGSYKKIMFDLTCTGDETDLSQCQYKQDGQCSFTSVLGVYCSEPRPPTPPQADGQKFALVPQFFSQNHFGDLANVISPTLDCFQGSGDCRHACVEIDLHVPPHVHTALIIYGEDKNGQKTRLWSSHNVKQRTRVILSNLDNLTRLHFTSYYNPRHPNSVTIYSIDYLPNCSPTADRCSALDSSKFCDNVIDCDDGRDEWGPACSGVNVNCSFESGMCGYSTNSPSKHWGVGTLKEISPYHYARLPIGEVVNGNLMYYLRPVRDSNFASDELRFPETDQLAQGGCLFLDGNTQGNFTLTSPQGHIYRSRQSIVNNAWFPVRINLPRGLTSLSFFMDTTRAHMFIREISLTPGQCTSETSVNDCPYGKKFLCGDGKEIHCVSTCDGVPDCSDQSDEIGCESCGLSQIQCPSNGQCIFAGQWCDGSEHCPNGEDELPGCGCNEDKTFTCTRNGQQTCRDFTHFCPPNTCSGFNDSPFCENFRFCDEEEDCCTDCCDSIAMDMCANGECVKKDKFCDGINDCGDFSDEMNCSCRSYEHVCDGTAVCVNTGALCDGRPDCPGATDEGLQCFNCDAETEFKCHDGLCVKKEQVCDSTLHCNDGSDELNCTESCSGWVCKTSGRCISLNSRCNGVFDCLTGKLEDLSDETDNCYCGLLEKRCDNGACIASVYWCNRVNDCWDNSDESKCARCPAGDWECLNGQCIREEFRCDGHNDCEDHSDETEDCGPGCPAGFVSSCGRTRCLPLTQICDGVSDCDDGIDELLCGSLKTLGGVADLVFFNKSQQSFPLCADGIGVDVLQDICFYLVNGNYVGHALSTLQGVSSVSFIKINPGNTGLTSRLTFGDCVSRAMIRLTCQLPSCGKRAEYSRAATLIIGGESSMPGEWPWMGYMTHLGIHRCGVSVINERWVLTAAHCATHKFNYPLFEAYVSVVVGSLSTTSLTKGAQRKMVEKIFVHPSYGPLKKLSVLNDVALLKLASPIDLQGTGIRPICLPKQHYNVSTHAVCYAAGWGWTIPKSRSQQFKLLHLRMPVIDTHSCQARWQSKEINDSLLCTGFDTGISLPCHGDSGGPLMCLDHHGYWTVQGVVSFGRYLCQPRNNQIEPSVFARISLYRDWIDETIQQNL